MKCNVLRLKCHTQGMLPRTNSHNRYNLVPVTRIEFWCNGWEEWIEHFCCTMDVEQQANDVRLDADRQKLDYENFIDDEEVTLHRHKRDTDVTDIPGSDVRDGLDTQREDWLLQMESLHGARPRRITRERPPLIDDHTGVMDLEAAGGTGGRQVEHHGFQTPLL